jgi:hypothetical protein
MVGRYYYMWVAYVNNALPSLTLIKLTVASLVGTRSIDILQAHEINASPKQEVRRLFLTNYYSFDLKNK